MGGMAEDRMRKSLLSRGEGVLGGERHMNKGMSASANSQSLLPHLHQPGLLWTGERTPCRAWGHPLPPSTLGFPICNFREWSPPPGPGAREVTYSELLAQCQEPPQPDRTLLPSNSFALGKQLGGPQAGPAS